MLNDQQFRDDRWSALQRRMAKEWGKAPSMEGLLFLIGVQELGKGNQRFTKEEKQDLMHIAVCKLLSFEGYYTLEGLDEEGWPHWKALKKLPFFSLDSQEELLKICAIEYFEQEIGWEF
jgi:hypothetical protein